MKKINLRLFTVCFFCFIEFCGSCFAGNNGKVINEFNQLYQGMLYVPPSYEMFKSHRLKFEMYRPNISPIIKNAPQFVNTKPKPEDYERIRNYPKRKDIFETPIFNIIFVVGGIIFFPYIFRNAHH